jgi:hypothetical protein
VPIARWAEDTMEAASIEESASRAALVVYTIVERQRDARKFWVRIGTAFRNRDGSMNVILDAMPTNGTIHIRAVRPLGSDLREAPLAELPLAGE